MLLDRIFKKYISIFMIMNILIISLMNISYADDVYRRISSVRITVSDYLKHYEYDGSGNSLPTISETDFFVPDNNQYEITNVSWYGDNNFNIGSTPYVEIYLSAIEKERSNDYYTYYYFGGSYDSTSVHVNGGSFVSASLVGSYTLKVIISLNGFKGTYAAPSSPTWSNMVLGRATWSVPTGSSGYYRVDLMRDSFKVASIITDQNTISLYPYMTKAASYYFNVYTIPYADSQINRGKESEPAQSTFLNILEDQISDGSGQYTDSKYILNNVSNNVSKSIYDPANTGNSTSVNGRINYNSGTSYTVYNASTGQTTTLQGYGSSQNSTNSYGTVNNGSTSSATTGNWYKEGNYWYFKTTSGTKVTNDWLIWKNAYYRFDADGRMITGFYDKDDYSRYYLSNYGAMKTGWALINNAWYYLNPQPGEYYGLMYRNTIVNIGDKSYFFDADGRMRTGWVIMKDNDGIDQYYYFYPMSDENDNDYGYMARNTTVLDGFTIADDGHWIH